MSSQYDPRLAVSQGGVQTQAEVDQGLRSYMLGIYNMMVLGVALTGLVAYAIGELGFLNSLFFNEMGRPTILMWVAIFAPVGVALFFGRIIQNMSTVGAQAVFFAFAALMGLSMSMIFMVYTGTSIAKVFFITAAMFGALSLYGYTTKKSLSGLGTFLFMGVIGLLIAMVVNIFLKSSVMAFIISVVGVLVFAGLTAYDTQKLKEMYLYNNDRSSLGKMAVYGALTLYLDFINMFQFLLSLFGDRE
jgi:uncharacterized protein